MFQTIPSFLNTFLLTSTGPPNEPSGVRADTTTTTSLMLHWFPGDTNGLPVEYYAIQWRVETDTLTMTEWRYINNDNGGSKYLFVVVIAALRYVH